MQAEADRAVCTPAAGTESGVSSGALEFGDVAGEPTTAPATRNQATLASRLSAGQRPEAIDFTGYLRALWYRVENLALDHRRTDGLRGTSACAYGKQSPTTRRELGRERY